MSLAKSTDTETARRWLALACAGRPASLIRGPESDPWLVFVRADLSAWGDESRARHVDDLGPEELAWARAGFEPSDLGSEDFRAEASHWRLVPGFLDWLGGGAHPHDVLGDLACGWRRGHASPELTARRAVLRGREGLAPAALFDALAVDPRAREAALDDPERTLRAWEAGMDRAWREAEFGEPLAFFGEALPSIPAGATLVARERRDGSWIFEHPEAEGWLCMMRRAPRRVRQSFFHSGREPVEIEG